MNQATTSLNDLILEKEVMKITGYSRVRLWELRRDGRLRWTSLNGRKIMYFKSDLYQKLNLNVA